MQILNITINKEEGSIVIRNSDDGVLYRASYDPYMENADKLIMSTIEMAMHIFM